MKTNKEVTSVCRVLQVFHWLAFFLLLAGAVRSEGVPDSVRATYRRAIGVREATGHNDGVEVERYLASVGLRRGAPWCAAFVSYCLQTGGYADAPRSGWSPAYFTPLNRYLFEKADAGLTDSSRVYLFGIYYERMGRIAHVGFIEPVTRFTPRGCVVTVEGNSNDNGSREGVAVVRKIRPRKSIKVVRGF